MDAIVENRREALKAKAPERRLWWRRVLMAGGVAIVLVGALAFWLTGGRYVSTDDAFVDANKLMVSTDVSGIVSEVDVKEGQSVHKGDVLFRLDPKPFQIALDQAQAKMAESALTIKSMEQDYQRMLSDIQAQRAQVSLADTTLKRQNALLRIGGTAQQNVDQAQATLYTTQSQTTSLQQQAEVQLAKLGGRIGAPLESHPDYMQAKATRDEAQRQLEHTVVKAPYDGTVTQVSSLQPGAMIVSSLAAFVPTSAVALVSDGAKWITANMKETDLTYVHPGQPVKITIDTFPDRVWHGTVASIAPATGAQFSVLPSENSSGNWVKVVQRLQARIAFDSSEDISTIRAGMSTSVSIDTNHKRKLSDLF
ncbi:MAG TPA: HlyD family secretion protein [Micropepsaceae bacterium]|nr:HlyD family secretion protein [Micropepsaceae bacterium]